MKGAHAGPLTLSDLEAEAAAWRRDLRYWRYLQPRLPGVGGQVDVADAMEAYFEEVSRLHVWVGNHRAEAHRCITDVLWRR